MWRAAMPGFGLDSLRGDGPQKWQPVMVVTSERSFILSRERDRDDPTPQILGLPSPDGRRLLDIDSYQLIEIQGETMVVGGDPDSRSAVLDRSAGTEAVLFLSGTTAGAHWGRWLSPDRFVLGGWQDTNDEAEERQGWLSVFDLRDSTIVSYSTRSVSRTDYEHYYEAWKRWLMKRYQEVKARPRT